MRRASGKHRLQPTHSPTHPAPTQAHVVEPHLLEQLALVAEEEGEEQGADVRAVHISVRQDDDLYWLNTPAQRLVWQAPSAPAAALRGTGIPRKSVARHPMSTPHTLLRGRCPGAAHLAVLRCAQPLPLQPQTRDSVQQRRSNIDPNHLKLQRTLP